MNDLLTFPEESPIRLAADCEKLMELLAGDICAWCAVLRAVDSKRNLPPSLQDVGTWTEHAVVSLIRLGAQEALKQGLLTTVMLRRLVHDPDLLEVVSEAFRSSADAITVDVTVRRAHTPERDAAEFLERLIAAVPGGSSPEISPPMVVDVEAEKKYSGRWELRAQAAHCVIRIVVRKEASLILHFDGDVWGAMQVIRNPIGACSIVACTGAFHEWSAGLEQLELRAAAATPTTTSQPKGRCEISEILGGIAIEFIVPR